MANIITHTKKIENPKTNVLVSWRGFDADCLSCIPSLDVQRRKKSLRVTPGVFGLPGFRFI